MNEKPHLSVVVAVQDGAENLPEIIAALGSGQVEGVEILICHSEGQPIGGFPGGGNIRIVASATSLLIPELWRDGILAARAATVALLSAHCVPDAEWLATALRLDMEDCVAYGGLIENDPHSDRVGAAIQLLRYNAFSPPQDRRYVADLAADNAVYSRADILACQDLVPLGFWEPSYHRRFRERGLTMAIEPALRVIHRNRYSPRAFMKQRRRHGRAFGLEKGLRSRPLERVLLVASAPLAFLVFGTKLAMRIAPRPELRRDLVRSAPWLAVFLANWSFGEWRGYVDSLGRRKRAA